MNITINKSNIDTFTEEKYENVIRFEWEAGNLRKDILEKFPNLEIFICTDNELTTLEPLVAYGY
jgi:hypothetical protein